MNARRRSENPDKPARSPGTHHPAKSDREAPLPRPAADAGSPQVGAEGPTTPPPDTTAPATGDAATSEYERASTNLRTRAVSEGAVKPGDAPLPIGIDQNSTVVFDQFARPDENAAVPQAPAAAWPTDDDQFVRRTLGGDRRAFDELIGRYQQRAASIAFRLLGNLHDSLEVCQEAFIRAYQNLGSLEDPNRFRPWFLRIVTNLSLNFRRARAVGGRRVSLDACMLDPDSDEPAFEVPSRAAETPGSRMAAAELSAAIRTALSELTDQQRTALVLFSIEQLPQKEVAAIMGCSVEAVKWHVFQARKRMKERLSPFLEDVGAP